MKACLNPQQYSLKTAITKSLRDNAPLSRGSIASDLKVETTELAEYLVYGATGDYFEPDDPCINSSSIAVSASAKLNKLIEVQQLKAKSAHLCSQLRILELNLSESRENGEKLAILCAQLEANQTALTLALASAEEIIEVQNLLLESRDQFENETKHTLSGEKADFCNNQHYILLKRLDAQEWKTDETGLFLDTSNLSSDRREFYDELDRFKRHIKRLKLECSKLRSTVIPIVSQAFSDDCSQLNVSLLCQSTELHDSGKSLCSGLKQFPKLPLSRLENLPHQSVEQIQEQSSIADKMPLQNRNFGCVEMRKLQLENAVLMQELNERQQLLSESKANLYLLMRELQDSKLSLGLKDNVLESQSVLIEDLREDLLRLQGASFGSFNETLAADKTRRIDQLAIALEKFTIAAEERHRQTLDFIGELKQANRALISIYSKAKSKYERRLQRLMVHDDNRNPL